MQMISQQHSSSKLISKRWGSHQAAPCPGRSAVASRRVVARATKLSVKGETKDVEDLLTFESSSSPSILKIKRSLVTHPARRLRSAKPSKRAVPAAANREGEDDEEPEFDEEDLGQQADSREPDGDAGFRAAALRDATATASTSGHAHLRSPSPSSASRLTNAAAMAAASTAGRRSDKADDFTPAAAASSRRATVNGLSLGSGIVSGPEDEELQQGHTTRNGQRRPLLAGDASSNGAVAAEDEEGSEEGRGGAHATNEEPAPRQTARPKLKGKLEVKHKMEKREAHPLPAGVTATRDVDIHDELRDCEDWRDVLDVVTDELEVLSVRTAVQALTRLNALTKNAGAGARRELAGMPQFQRLVTRLHSLASVMNNVQLSNGLLALAQLQVPVSEEVLQLYYQAGLEQSQSFYPRDIATLFSALAKMQVAPPKDLCDSLGFRAMGFLNAGDFDARSTSTMLHSLALLGYKNSILVQATADHLAAPGVMSSLAPPGVANAMWGLARLGIYHQPAIEAALAAFSADPMSYKPQECANLLWAITASRHHPGPAFALFAKSLLSRVDDLRAADLATLLYSLGYFNVAPGAQALSRIAARVSALLAAQEKAEAGGHAAAALPGPAGSPQRQQPKQQQQQRRDGRGLWTPGASAMNTVEVCNMYWGLALLGEVQVPLFAQLEARLAVEWERSGGALPESLLRMMFQAFLASRLVEGAESRPSGLPPLLLDACKRTWTVSVSGRAVLERSRHTVDYVANILTTLKITHDKRRPTGDGLALIDLALKLKEDTYVALQVIEDVQHCANDSRGMLGTTIMQRKLLERNGWEVRYINFSDLERLTPEVQPMFVADLLRRLGVRVRTTNKAQAARPSQAPAGGPGPSAEAAAEAEAAAAAADPGGGRGPRGAGRASSSGARRR